MGLKATDIKYKPTGPLADIIGTRSMKRGAVQTKIWDYIKDKQLQGVKDSGDTVKYKTKAGKTKTSKGGQILYVGEDPAMKKLCKNKKKISMMSLAGMIEPHLERQD